MFDIALCVVVVVVFYMLIRFFRTKATQRDATHKLIAFCKQNDMSIPEDSMLRRHFLTQLQHDIDCAR